MPKDNTTQPVTDDQTPLVGTSTPTTDTSTNTSSTTTPPTVSVLEDVVVPPMVDTGAGSAAPVSDVVTPESTPLTTTTIASTPRKKTMGGKVIATILGLFLLVGGVGAGLFLVQQNQNIEEEASCSGAAYEACRRTSGTQVCNCRVCGECTRDDDPGTPGTGCTATSSSACTSSCSQDGYKCTWSSSSSSCGKSSQPCTGADNGSGELIVEGECGANQSGSEWVQCGASGAGGNCRFCMKVYQRTCNQALADRGCDVVIGNQCGDVNGSVNIYYCEGEGNTGGPGGCQGNDPRPGGVGWDDANKRITGSFCGTVQVDDIENDFCSRTDTSGCSSNPPPTNPPPTPSPTPLITASCQNLKAYSTTNSEVPLTTQQLSALRPGNQFNLCVQGIKTGGSFDKVRFTINGVLQPEQAMTGGVGTTNEDRFCTLYTIPQTLPAGGAFTFRAEMHHVTLGWR